MNSESFVDDEGHRKGRHRKKQLYSSILQQMEFYFGDSNLGKDRFLSQLTQENPYVDVSVFLQFNKIRKLTSSIKDITKALVKSKFLELSEDKTKVKRSLPVAVKENIDECTLYVERLKSDTTHEWLNTIFSEFGNVSYVSIPKYKHSGMLKGFAFVEFEKEESVNAALQCFENIGCKIPLCTEPDDLCSIVAYNIETNTGTDETLKRKSDSVSEEEPVVKKGKFVEEQDADESLQNIKEEIPIDDQEETTTSNEKKKKKLKKSHRKKMILKELGLQILSKKDWKKMRNQYLNKQRKNMKELKLHLNRQRFAQKKEIRRTEAIKDKDQISTEKTTPPAEIEFIPNVIVKLTLEEACYTPKLLRRKIKTYSPDIKYVEIPFGTTDAYLRFGDSKSAKEFCTSDYKEKTVLLEGDEEKDYWSKIGESATAKKEKQSKITKKRGRDKLLLKAEKHMADHIRFNDETNE